MVGIAAAGVLLGFLADKIGRKRSIILGLALFTLNSYLFAIGHAVAFFILLLAVSGCAIGIFKTGALALIGDMSNSTRQHTSIMNMVEGFFGVGAIIGPAIVARLLTAGLSWQWLYVIVGTVCASLIVIAALLRYPAVQKVSAEPIDLKRTLSMMKNPYALGIGWQRLYYRLSAGAKPSPRILGVRRGCCASLCIQSGKSRYSKRRQISPRRAWFH